MPAEPLVPACVWRISPALVLALDERFGEPVDAYVNGSQVWMRDDGPGGIALEWRLHPVAGFRRPPALGTYDLFPTIALALAGDDPPAAPPESLWDGLEAFPAYGDETEPLPLRRAATDSLGIAPDACGLVDHRSLADEWERRGGGVSVIEGLLRQLGPPEGSSGNA
jgi:hypothetical protein